MGSKDEHLGNLDVGRSISGKYGNIGNIIARQRLDALIDTCSTIVIPMETDVAEISLDKTRLQVSNTDSRISYIDAKSI